MNNPQSSCYEPIDLSSSPIRVHRGLLFSQWYVFPFQSNSWWGKSEYDLYKHSMAWASCKCVCMCTAPHPLSINAVLLAATFMICCNMQHFKSKTIFSSSPQPALLWFHVNNGQCISFGYNIWPCLVELNMSYLMMCNWYFQFYNQMNTIISANQLHNFTQAANCGHVNKYQTRLLI
jgi:hypothetical protein